MFVFRTFDKAPLLQIFAIFFLLVAVAGFEPLTLEL
jgi:hypothetical protein